MWGKGGGSGWWKGRGARDEALERLAGLWRGVGVCIRTV